jgi:hypothetical protein
LRLKTKFFGYGLPENDGGRARTYDHIGAEYLATGN